jgi:hypothetical protein
MVPTSAVMVTRLNRGIFNGKGENPHLLDRPVRSYQLYIFTLAGLLTKD